jgi:tetratricopeptide (TPR) repeat protein
MTAREHHQRVKEILGAVLEVPPAERELTLNERCCGDEELRREVEALLEFDTTTQGFRGDPFVLLRPESPEGVGDRIGPYKVLRPLGEGGMGAVYLAEKDGEIGLKVALKILHRGMNTDAIVQRFRNERRILAHLHHPMIGQIHDGGATDDGRPYFAMEVVEGKPIDAYCRDAGLSVRERLELFQRACEAVAASHRNLVAHLDLKPSNILVTTDGTPKLLDFGIAKILDPASEMWTRMTALGERPMTPPYASPEQIRGEPLGAPSDIFSLGVILYELLTGVRPFPGEGMSLRFKIVEKDPQRPSTLIKSRAGRKAKRILRPLSGDLDAIVMKALRKQPDERYASVEGLSEDIGNYLAGLPVKARVHSFRYRAGKFVRRNRWRLLTATAFFVLAVGLLVSFVLQMEQRQQVQREKYRATVSLLSSRVFFRVVENIDPSAEETSLDVEAILKLGQDLYGDEFADLPEAQAAVLDNVGRFYSSRGFYRSAMPLIEDALKIRRQILGEENLLVAESLHNLAQLQSELGEDVAAEERARRALDIQRRQYNEPTRELAIGINNYGLILSKLERHSEAEKLFREALQMKIALYGKGHLQVVATLANLGSSLYRQSRYAEALSYHQQALDVRREFLPQDDLGLGSSYGYLGLDLVALEDYAAAVPPLRQALRIHRSIRGDHHASVATKINNLAFALQRTGKSEEARGCYMEALRISIESYGQEDYRTAIFERNLATADLDLGEADSCEAHSRRALAVFLANWPQGHWRIADVRSVLGACLAAAGRFLEAEPLLLEGYQALLEEKGEGDLYTRDARRRLFDTYTQWEKPEKAAAFRDEPPPAQPD